MLSFLVLSWALSFGYVPDQVDSLQGLIVMADQNRFASFVTVEGGVTAWDRIHIYGSVETYQYLVSDSISFAPYRADYIAGADVYITDWLSAGIVHECDHPVMSVVKMPSIKYESEYNYLKTETKIFIKIGSNVREHRLLH